MKTNHSPFVSNRTISIVRPPCAEYTVVQTENKQTYNEMKPSTSSIRGLRETSETL